MFDWFKSTLPPLRTTTTASAATYTVTLFARVIVRASIDIEFARIIVP